MTPFRRYYDRQLSHFDCLDLAGKDYSTLTKLTQARSDPKEIKGAFVWEYSGIRMYSGIYSGYSVPGSRIARMESRYSRMRIAPKQTLRPRTNVESKVASNTFK